MEVCLKVRLIAQPPSFDLAQPAIIDATSTGLCCVFGNDFLPRCRPDVAGFFVKSWNKPLPNHNLHHPVISSIILAWQGGP